MKALLIVAIFYQGEVTPVFHTSLRLTSMEECQRQATTWKSWEGTLAGAGINKVFDHVYPDCKPVDKIDMQGLLESMKP